MWDAIYKDFPIATFNILPLLLIGMVLILPHLLRIIAVFLLGWYCVWIYQNDLYLVLTLNMVVAGVGVTGLRLFLGV